MNSHNEIHDSEYESSDASEYYESDSDQLSDVGSIESFSGDLTQLRHVVASINSTIETLETQLISMQRPIEQLHLDQLGDIPFLQSSPFRHTMLKFKSDVRIPGIDTKQRYSFADIMKHVRTYLFESGAIQADGSIKLSKEMRKQFGIKESELSYIEIMQHMREFVH
jgi:TolA-binding protein